MTLHSTATRLLRAARCLALALPLAALAAPIDDMRQQVEAGQLARAYDTAMHNPQLIGDVHFDFLYGLAAIGTGHAPEGILALERHLAAVPGNDRARLELARGYFLVGEYARARSEFEFVLRYNPPANVRENIARYMKAMELRDSGFARATSRLYGEAGIGYDSNVNGGTFRDEVQFPFGPQSLVGTSSKGASDDFIQLSAGALQSMRVSNRMSVFAGIDLDQKQNFKLRDFDLSTLGANVGFSLVSGPGVYRGTLAFNKLLVGENPYRDTLTLGGEASFTPGADLSATAFTQYAEFRYAGGDNVRDARALTFGGMLTRNFSGAAGAPSVGIRVSWTQEDNLRLRTDLSRRIPLVRLFGSISPADSWRIAGGLTVFEQSFRATDVVFGSARADTTVSLDLTATYSIAPRWTLRAEALASVNRSNQDLYDTRRQTIAVKSRYQY
jgi:tetratricopeptide (TPR) repeat protein